MTKKKVDSDGNALGAQRPRAPRTAQTNARVFLGWVNINLNDEQKAEFSVWCADKDFASLLDKLTGSAYRLSVYWDDYNDTYAASLTCWLAASGQCGYSLSMRGSDAVTAIWRVIFTHYAVCLEDWGPYIGKSTRSDW